MPPYRVMQADTGRRTLSTEARACFILESFFGSEDWKRVVQVYWKGNIRVSLSY
jgi:hypothetical protein